MKNYLVVLQDGEPITVEAENRNEVTQKLTQEYDFAAGTFVIVSTISDYEAECYGYDTY